MPLKATFIGLRLNIPPPTELLVNKLYLVLCESEYFIRTCNASFSFSAPNQCVLLTYTLLVLAKTYTVYLLLNLFLRLQEFR